MEKEELHALIKKYLSGKASPEEQEKLNEWYDQFDNDLIVRIPATEEENEEFLKAKMLLRLQNEIRKDQVPVVSIKRYRWPRVAAAASIILFLAAGSYLLFFNKRNTNQEQVSSIQEQIKDLPPGRDAAILTLANGKQFLLDSANGTITNQNGIAIINLNGLLSYQQSASAEASEDKQEWHTITTARGNQYQLELADGSRVWLNSASSLHFPNRFTDAQRKVELTGEGYFEIAPRSLPTPDGVGGEGKKQPFIVSVNGKQVEVLGTHFNINSYEDEGDFKTTLLEGAVRVSHVGNVVLLKPGEQAEVQNNSRLNESVGQASSIRIIRDIDIEKVMAWRTGFFEFDDTDLATIMRQISRWYDVDIVYDGKPGTEKFGGRISKNLKLSNVLRLLEESGVKFRLEGKSLVVIP